MYQFLQPRLKCLPNRIFLRLELKAYKTLDILMFPRKRNLDGEGTKENAML